MTRTPRLAVIIPAYNEANSIGRLIAELRSLHPNAMVFVIDDASRDATGEASRTAGARVVRHPFNLGYGAGLQTGYKRALAAGADLIVQMDADGQHLPSEVATIVEPVASGAVDLCLGSRFLAATGYVMSPIRTLGREVFKAIARPMGLHISDPTTGFQAMTREVARFYAGDWYPTDYPDIDVLIMARRRGFRIAERSVKMTAGYRESLLHSGWKPFYYVYRMMLSLWAASATQRPR